MTHRHHPIPNKRRVIPFGGPVSDRQNPSAHGWACTIDTCRCGLERRTNWNQSARERGPWEEPRP